MNDPLLKPHIVVSRCLGFAQCRYDGAWFEDPFVNALRPHAQWITVCPETSLGLGCPRPKIRVVEEEDRRILFQPDTERDLTQAMLDFSASLCKGLPEVDGFILKSKSPSCGLRGTKTYADRYAEPHIRRGTGFFADAMRKAFPRLPMVDEQHLNDSTAQRAFLVRIFASAALRHACQGRSLRAFHAQYRHVVNAVDAEAANRLDMLLESAEDYERAFGTLIAQSAEWIAWPLPEPVAALIREPLE